MTDNPHTIDTARVAADVLAGVRIAGAAVFVEECLADGAQALVY